MGNVLRRLFRREQKQVAEPMHGRITAQQAEAEREGQASSRRLIEAEIAGDRSRRGATDVRPGDPTD